MPGGVLMPELIPENMTYKVDASGRIIIPSYMRAKFEIDLGDWMDYYTTKIDGKYFLCVCLHTDEDGNKVAYK